MKKIRIFFRIFHINYVLSKYGFDQIVLANAFFAPVKFLSYFNPWNWFRNKTQTRGERIRLVLEELGPVFVKFGQTLSTRSDLIPEDIMIELEKLQDKVPPFSPELAIKIIEAEYQQTISTVFANFIQQPKASASIAQVHEVQLHEGKRAIIKILRPGIIKKIDRDVELLYSLARLAERFWSQGRRLHLTEIVAEFDNVIHDELDLMREAANASQLRRNFLNSDMLYIPEIYWPYARTNVVVMEYVSGIPIADLEKLISHGINLKKLAELGVEIFFTQVFRDRFFHADMHPGNIFVHPDKPDFPQYIAVDFGIVGSLSPEDQRYLAYNILAFFQRDYRKAALLHIESGWVAKNTRVTDLEAAIRTVCEPIFERPLKEISFGRTLMRLFQIGRRFNMQVQPQLLLLQKTLLHIEGLGRKLYPELDLWATAKPFLENWLKQQISVKAVVQKIYNNSPQWGEQLPELPTLIFEALQTLKKLPETLAQSEVIAEQASAKLLNKEYRKYVFTGFVLGFAVTIILIYFFY